MLWGWGGSEFRYSRRRFAPVAAPLWLTLTWSALLAFLRVRTDTCEDLLTRSGATVEGCFLMALDLGRRELTAFFILRRFFCSVELSPGAYSESLFSFSYRYCLAPTFFDLVLVTDTGCYDYGSYSADVGISGCCAIRGCYNSRLSPKGKISSWGDEGHSPNMDFECWERASS